MSLRSKRLGKDARAEEIRALAPEPRAVEDDVRAIVEAVRRDGDAAVRRFTEQFDHAELAPDELRVPVAEVDEAVALLEPDVLRGLRKAIANVRAVAEAQLRDPVAAPLEDGQHVEIVEAPVRRAAAYVPGGRAPYPSTVVMCAVTARVAGVDEFAVCAPPGPGGQAHPIDARGVRALRRERGLPDGRRAGDRGARLRHGDRPARRHDRRTGERVRHRGQAPGGRRRRHRRPGRARASSSSWRPTAPTQSSSRSTCSPSPSTERTARSS